MIPTMSIDNEIKNYLIKLGKRIAKLRKAKVDPISRLKSPKIKLHRRG